jgi:hypothetical protein
MKINSPDQLGLGRVRRACNELWCFIVVGALVVRCFFLDGEIWRRLNVFYASLVQVV